MADAFNPSAIINESARAAAVQSSSGGSGGGSKSESQKVEEKRLAELYKVNPKSSEFKDPAKLAAATKLDPSQIKPGTKVLVQNGNYYAVGSPVERAAMARQKELWKSQDAVYTTGRQIAEREAKKRAEISRDAAQQRGIDEAAASRFQKRYESGQLREEAAAAEENQLSIGLGFGGANLPKEILQKIEDMQPFRDLRRSQIMQAQDRGYFEAKGISSTRYTKQYDEAEARGGGVSFLGTTFSLAVSPSQAASQPNVLFSSRFGMSKAPIEEGVIFGGVSLKSGGSKVFVAPPALSSQKPSPYGLSEYFKATKGRAMPITSLKTIQFAGEGSERAFYPREIKISYNPTAREAVEKAQQAYLEGNFIRRLAGEPTTIEVSLPGAEGKVETARWFSVINDMSMRYDAMRKEGKSLFFGQYPELGQEKNYTGVFKSLGSKKATVQDQLIYGGLTFTIDETAFSLVKMGAGFTQAASYGGILLAGTKDKAAEAKFWEGLGAYAELPVTLAILGKGQKFLQGYAGAKAAQLSASPIFNRLSAPVAKALPFEVHLPTITKAAFSAPVVFGGVGFASSFTRTGRFTEAVGAGLGTGVLVGGWKGIGAAIEAANKRLPSSLAYDARGTVGFFKLMERNFVQSKMLDVKQSAKFMLEASPSEVRAAMSEGNRYMSYQTAGMLRKIPVFGERKPIYFGKARNSAWSLAPSLKAFGYEVTVPRARQIIGTKPNPAMAKYGFSIRELQAEMLAQSGKEMPSRYMSVPLEGFQYPKGGELVRNPKFAEFFRGKDA